MFSAILKKWRWFLGIAVVIAAGVLIYLYGWIMVAAIGTSAAGWAAVANESKTKAIPLSVQSELLKHEQEKALAEIPKSDAGTIAHGLFKGPR